MDFLFHIDLPTLVRSAGYVGIAAIVFAETGFFFGFVLPGDSLLVTAGLLAAAGFLNIWVLVPLVVLAAIAGDNLGYWFGEKFGPRIFAREDSFFFKRRYVAETERYYAKHGPSTVILSRFIPVVRSFAPIMAGVGSMTRATFFRYNVAGGLLWGAGLTLIPYGLGQKFPQLENYLPLIIVCIVAASFVPVAIELWRNRRRTP